MKRFQLALFVFSVSISFAQAQSDTISIKNIPTRHISSDFNQTIFDKSLQSMPLTLDMNSFYKQKLTETVLRTPTITIASFYNPLIPTLNIENDLYNQYRVSNQSWISTSRTSNAYQGLGGVYTINANYNVKVGGFAILSAGMYASKYNIYNNFQNGMGFNGNIKFVLSDRISINASGQYSTQGNKNGISPFLSTMYPSTNYGGSFEFKVTDKWGLIMGAQQEFDVFTRKWVTTPYILPLFYKH
jgi:hypothetical protein